MHQLGEWWRNTSEGKQCPGHLCNVPSQGSNLIHFNESSLRVILSSRPCRFKVCDISMTFMAQYKSRVCFIQVSSNCGVSYVYVAFSNKSLEMFVIQSVNPPKAFSMMARKDLLRQGVNLSKSLYCSFEANRLLKRNQIGKLKFQYSNEEKSNNVFHTQTVVLQPTPLQKYLCIPKQCSKTHKNKRLKIWFIKSFSK